MSYSAPVLPGSDAASIAAVARILHDGGVAVVPTDTVYGLSASVFQPQAIERIFAIKQRPPDAQVPVLLATAADLTLVAEDVPRNSWNLINRYWPGALTLVFPARRNVPRVVTRGGPTVAVRVPSHGATLQLLEVLGEPIIGTSANVSGRPAAVTAAEAVCELGPLVDAVLESDVPDASRVPSTVVEVLGDGWRLVREGAISLEDIRLALGTRITRIS